MAYRYGQYRDVIPGLLAAQREAEALQKKFNVEGFLDAYSPGWRERRKPGWLLDTPSSRYY